MVNTMVPLVPPGVVIVTFCAPGVAPAAIAKVAVTVVEFVTLSPDTVMSEPALILVAPVRLVPVRVTGTVVPTTPVFGAKLERVGAGVVPALCSATAAHDHDCGEPEVIPGAIAAGVAIKYACIVA